MMLDEREIVVVIPAYNEGRSIVDIVRRAEKFARVIVVNDGSTDGTLDALSATAAMVHSHSANRGKTATLLTGFSAAAQAGAGLIITLDGDGQHLPEDIPRLISAAKRHSNQIIIGSRMADRGAFPPARYFGNSVANFWISWAAGYDIEDSQSGFRAYPVSVIQALAPRYHERKGFVLESELLIDAATIGVRSYSVPIPAIYRGSAGRKSYFRPWVDVLRIISMVAKKLLKRGMYIRGLLRMLNERRRKRRASTAMART